MATTYKMIDVISDATGIDHGRVRQCARQLLDDDVLPRSVGSQVAMIGLQHVVLLLIAAVAADAIKDSSRVAIKYCGLTKDGRWPSEVVLPGHPDSTLTLGTFLATLLGLYVENPKADGLLAMINSANIALCLTSPSATVTMDMPKHGLQTFEFTEPGGAALLQAGRIKRTVEIPGDMLALIAMGYERAQSGWVIDTLKGTAVSKKLRTPKKSKLAKPIKKSKARR